MIQKLQIIKIITEILIIITVIQSTQAQSRCEYLCQNDDNCRKGLCVLTYCIDTPVCYRYCFQCFDREECQQSGEYCGALTVADQIGTYLLKSKSDKNVLNLNLFSVVIFVNFLK